MSTLNVSKIQHESGAGDNINLHPSGKVEAANQVEALEFNHPSYPNNDGNPCFTVNENLIELSNGLFIRTTQTHEPNEGTFIGCDGNAQFYGDVMSLSQNGGQLAGFRSVIQNGDFRVWQRGTSITSGTAVYTADRWKFSGASAGDAATIERSSTAPEGFDYSLRFTSGSFNGLQQGIELESQRGAPFVEGSQWTLSFWCNRVPTSAFLKWRAVVGDNADSADAANFTSFTAGETSGAFTKYTTTFTILATRPTATQICLNLGILLDSSLGSTNLAGIQFEPGSVCTPFENIPIGTSLQLCQRYFQIISFNNIVFNANSSSSNAVAKTGGAGSQRTGSPTITSLGTEGNKVFYSTGRYEGNTSNNSDNANVTGGSIIQGTASLNFSRKGTSGAAICTIGGGEQGKFSYDREL